MFFLFPPRQVCFRRRWFKTRNCSWWWLWNERGPLRTATSLSSTKRSRKAHRHGTASTASKLITSGIVLSFNQIIFFIFSLENDFHFNSLLLVICLQFKIIVAWKWHQNQWFEEKRHVFHDNRAWMVFAWRITFGCFLLGSCCSNSLKITKIALISWFKNRRI